MSHMTSLGSTDITLDGNYIHHNVWDEITYPIPEIQRLRRWSLGMDE